jgi:hypothetical protein
VDWLPTLDDRMEASLILYGAYAKRIRTPDYPWAPTADERERDIEGVERAWGGPRAARRAGSKRCKRPVNAGLVGSLLTCIR